MKQNTSYYAMSYRQQKMKRLEAMRRDRTPKLMFWKELADYIMPWRYKYLQNNPNQLSDTSKAPSSLNSKVVNSRARRAQRTLSAAIMSAICNPQTTWFMMTTPDPSLAETDSVRRWLSIIENIMRQLIARSNLYGNFSSVCEDIVTFGPSVLQIDEDPTHIFRTYSYPIGQYMLSNNDELTIDTVYREFSMTVKMLIRKFGVGNVSPFVKNAYDRGDYDKWINVFHVLEPNEEYEEGVLGPQSKPFKSCWFERDRPDDGRIGFLSEGGYNEFPAIVPRWNAVGEDPYGYSAAMEALGDAKALQHLERRKAQLVDKLTLPPMVGPSSLSHRRVSLLPGDVTLVDSNATGQELKPAMLVPPQGLTAINDIRNDHELRIDQALFSDIFLAMINTDRREMTAEEVRAKVNERLMVMGPTTHRLHFDLMDPMMHRIFMIAWRAGMFPPPPIEMQGREIKVEYLGMFTQAQKLNETTQIERLSAFTLQLANARPEVVDKLNVDEMVDAYREALGVAPSLVNDDEAVASIRQARQAQIEAKDSVENAGVAADAAKKLGDTPLDGNNAFTELLKLTQGGGMA